MRAVGESWNGMSLHASGAGRKRGSSMRRLGVRFTSNGHMFIRGDITASDGMMTIPKHCATDAIAGGEIIQDWLMTFLLRNSQRDGIE